MFVVDYLRSTPGPTIVIPSFHTGPIGLLPETEVHVALMEGNAGFEVVIRPYQSNAENIMRLSCTMKDEPGVVGRIIAAVSDLGINVVNEVTSAIDHQNFHRVDLLLDWTTSKFPHRSASSTRTKRHYRDYHSLFPTGVQRYVELFDSIMAHCENVILREDVNGTSLPVISLQEVQTPTHLQPYGPVTVNRHANHAYHVEIDLPAPLITRLRLKLRIGSQPLHYILLSETETRTLRAFFPRSETLSRLVHLGFFHVDAPGALSAILSPLARAGFNIVTSLLRQNKDGKNVWEAVLEYRGADVIPTPGYGSPSPEAGETLCSWAAERVLAAAESDEVERLRECDLQIGLPRYPRRSWEGRIEFRSVVPSGRPVNSLTAASAPEGSGTPDRSRLIEFIHRGRMEAMPSIFLSYSSTAKGHAELIRSALDKRYQIIDYQEPDSEVIVDQVVHRIEACDYFIGIWRPENDSKMSISPWLHFEYGIAVASGKKSIIVHSESLDPRIWKRINPGIAQPEFSDLHFASRAVPMIDAYCREHFRDDGNREQFHDITAESAMKTLQLLGTR